MFYLRNLVFCPLLILIVACGGSSDAETPQGGHGSGGGSPGGMGGSRPTAAVPVQVGVVRSGRISQHLETNGTLEAENEVDLVARGSGPITELVAEEGDTLSKGTLLARIDDREARNQVANATVSQDEAQLAFNRTKTTYDKGLVSQESYDTAFSQLQATKVQLENAEIQLAYTEIRAPFDSLVVTRYIKHSEFVSPGMPLFRVSDFTPLLCPIQVPEKDLSRLRKGQPARIEVEAFSGQSFDAKVLRIRPTVDAATGTVTVTLAVDGRGQLRPGMFASVYLETDTRNDVLVIPRSALVLDSIGDTVFVRNGDVAERREVRLGFREEGSVEVLEGLVEGEELIVLGQDGLADGTPVSLLESEDSSQAVEQRSADASEPTKERGEAAHSQGRSGPGGRMGGGGIPPAMEQRIKDASPEDLKQIKERMQQFTGKSADEIDELVKKIRSDAK
ncbi:MAG: efflux RND transporter periplasmic adaptor subunit [bacterium]|nr:efflux RND transporter periplasmic adaptor subunit [bacterium]